MPSNMYGTAESFLYRYQAMKRKQAKAVGEVCEDAICSAYGQAAGGDRVISSNKGDPTQRGGLRAATARDSVLTVEERMWVDAIESAWAEMLARFPDKARLMEITYGLVGREPVNRAQRAYLRDVAMGEACIESLKTFYQWKADCVNTVIYHALAHKIRAG